MRPSFLLGPAVRRPEGMQLHAITRNRARSVWRHLATALLLLALSTTTLSGCTVISDDQSKKLANSGKVLVDVRGTKVAYRFPALPPRPTVAQGATAGALEGAGETVGQALMFDPYAIILLPIMIPVGAVIGAAQVPDDEEWREIARRYQRMKEAQTSVFRDRRQKNTTLEIEAGVIAAFREKSNGCIAPSRRATECRNAQPTSIISVNLQPVIDGEGYTLRTAVAVATPGASEVTCIRRDYKRFYTRQVAEAGMTAERIIGDIDEMHRAFGRLLAFELYEAPGRRNDKEIGRDRMAAWEGIGNPMEGELPCLELSEDMTP